MGRGAEWEEPRDEVFVLTPRGARIGVKLLLGMTQPPPASLIDLGWGVRADFSTSLVETKIHLLTGEVAASEWSSNSVFRRPVDMLCYSVYGFVI